MTTVVVSVLLVNPAPLVSQELVRLLQQTIRSSQDERRPSAGPEGPGPHRAPPPPPLKERGEQIRALCGHMEKLALEKENLQQELKTLKNKVGEMNDQLSMLMETIQAKDEVIIKLSQQQQQQQQGGAGGTSGDDASPTESGSPSAVSRELQEMDKMKVGAAVWELHSLLQHNCILPAGYLIYEYILYVLIYTRHTRYSVHIPPVPLS